MNSSDAKIDAADNVRRAFRLRRAEILRADPLDPLIVDPDYFADPSDRTVKSVLLRSDGAGLFVQVPQWFVTDEDLLRIEHSRDGVGFTSIHEERIRFFDDPISFPYPVKLDLTLDALQPEGVHYFRSYIMSDNFEEKYSDPITLRFDRVPPYNRDVPNKFAGIPVVTDDSLAAGNDKVLLTLPAYPDWEAGDKVRWYWLNEIPTDVENIEEVGTLATTGQAQQLEVPGDYVRKVNDGGVYAVYVLFDKAGNISQISDYLAVDVALGTLPTVFDPPEVPLATAADGFLIDQADALEGVEVWVPLFDDHKPTDTVKVIWKAAHLKPQPVGSTPESMIRFPVDSREILLTEYDDSSVPDVTLVRYEVYRGTHLLGGNETQVNVDFESIDPGWPGPDWPDPEHAGLNPVRVAGKGGTSGENELDINDTGKAADITIELHDFALEDDVLTLSWGDQEGAARYTVSDSDVPGEDVTFEVPWAVIEAGGNNPALPVSYWVSRPDVHNPLKSRDTPVLVNAIKIVAQAPGFLDANAAGQLNCSTIRASLPHADGGAVQVTVPDLTQYTQYGAITEFVLTWWAVKGGNEDQGEDEVPGVRESFPVPLGADYPLEGFTWRVPYLKHVAPTFDPDDPLFYRARARVVYSFTAGTEDISSERGEIVLAMYEPSGACDLT